MLGFASPRVPPSLEIASIGRLRRALGPALVVIALLAIFPVYGQEEPDVEDRPEAETSVSVAPVVIDGTELFHVRGAGAYPATTRAAMIARVIVSVARDRSIDVSTIRLEDSELGPRVIAGDGKVVLVTAIDSDARRESLSQRELAAVYKLRIQTAVTSYRELRSPEHLKRAIAWTAGATLLLVVLLLGMLWVFRRLDRVIGRRLEARVERLRIQSFRLLSPEQTWRLLRTVLHGLRAVTTLVLAYAYLNSTLSLFPWTRGFSQRMFDLLLDPLAMMARAVVSWIPSLAFLVMLLIVTRIALRLIGLFFHEIARGAVTFASFDAEWAMPTFRLVRILVVAFAVVVAFPYIPGSSTEAFKGVSLFIGVLFSLGSSSVVGNVIAGYTMTYRRAFRNGDRIQVGDVIGDVTQTRLLVTNVRTPKNEDVVIPNSLILSSLVTNYSALARKGGLILHTRVGIGYEVPWRQVEAMLLIAARRTEGLLPEPAPFVLQTTLGDFAVTYELNAYCDTAQRAPLLYSEMHRNILDVFNEHGVQIMTPAYESDPPEPKLVRGGNWYPGPAEPPEGSP